jgi:RimJ/RimL family protein N-acetyltransferase
MPETDVQLRPVTEADLPNYVRWFNDPEVTQWLMRDPGLTMEQEREWFKRLSEDPNELVLAIEAEGRHIGNCALSLHRRIPTATLGIGIGDRSAWGKGYGTAATRRLLRIGFEERGLERIQLDTWARNLRARRCYEKCGFRHEGLRRRAVLKGGEWLDVVQMAILREEWQAMQASPPDGLCALGPEHADEAIALWSQVDLWPRRTEDRRTVRALLAHNARFALGWRASGQLVATIVGGWDGLRGWIYRLGVHPAHRRRGIAGTLIAEVERRLTAAGALQINLMAYGPNVVARSLYERRGYETANCVVMRKRFEAEPRLESRE